MAHPVARQQQAAFAGAVAELLRQSRRAQHLTQTDISERTGGLISKAALANYETGHRSLRIDVFWMIAKALGEDPGTLLTAAERGSGYGMDATNAPVTVDVDSIQRSSDPRLAPVRRWFTLRLQRPTTAAPKRSITLDAGALAALAELMGTSRAECRTILAEVGGRSDATANETTQTNETIAQAG